MTTRSWVARLPLCNRSTPAKLARSRTLMWLLLALASAACAFAYGEESKRLHALNPEANPSLTGGYQLLVDLDSLRRNARFEFLPPDPSIRSAARDQDLPLRQQVQADIEAASRWVGDRGLYSLLTGRVEQSRLPQELRAAFSEYEEKLAAARTILDTKGVEAAHENALAVDEFMDKKLYPAAHALFQAGVEHYEKNVALARQLQTAFRLGVPITGIVLLVFIGWQYLFILRKGTKTVWQGTLITLLLSALVWTYAFEGLRGAGAYVEKAPSWQRRSRTRSLTTPRPMS